MMEQYQKIKSQHQDKFVLFRLGDFYELFFEDAIEGAALMEIVLTNRNGTPMCGVPHHQLKNYAYKLLQSGKKIAIVEQKEQPKQPKEAQQKETLIKREIREILTPASLIDESLLQATENNFLLAVEINKNSSDDDFLICCQCDLSTGEIFLDLLPFDKHAPEIALENALAMSNTKEVLIVGKKTSAKISPLLKIANQKIMVNEVTKIPKDHLDKLEKLCGDHADLFFKMGFANTLLATIDYLRNNREIDEETFFSTLLPPVFRPFEKKLFLDERTKENLEVFKSNSQESDLTLVAIIDRTITPMGSRRLKQELTMPMLSYEEIKQRLNRVSAWQAQAENIFEMRRRLSGLKDISRLATRIALGRTGVEELMLLKTYLTKTHSFIEKLLEIKKTTHAFDGETEISYQEKHLTSLLASITSLCQHIESTIVSVEEDEKDQLLSSAKKSKVGIRIDCHLELKENIEKRNRCLQEMLVLLKEEQQSVGKLRLRYNDSLGYFFEVSKVQANQMPSHFIRKQTLTNSERFTTEKLIDLEGSIAQLKSQCDELEKDITLSLNQKVHQSLSAIKKISLVVAILDVELGFAHLAIEENFSKPELSEGPTLLLEEARHPVVEKMLSKTGQAFVKNSICIGHKQCVHIITGPNMSGKSTFLRQTAIIVIMAHLGCFVPAKKAIIPQTDRVFTRVGATDRLTKGESTFLVEMKETAYILRYATKRSLVILDEIGRGTSTYDGLSIAYGIVQYLITTLQKTKTLFATHYHELTQMSKTNPAFIENYNVAVSEDEGKVIFLKKVVPGMAKQSYGIHVAELAGLPKQVTDLAKKILASLEAKRHPLQLEDTAPLTEEQKTKPALVEPTPVEKNPTLEEIIKTDPLKTTPLEALNLIIKWQKVLKDSPADKNDA